MLLVQAKFKYLYNNYADIQLLTKVVLFTSAKAIAFG